MPLPQLKKTYSQYRQKTKYSVSRVSGSQPLYFRKRKKKNIFRRTIKYALIFGFVLFIAGGIGAVAMFATVSKSLPNPGQIIDRNVPESTKIYDRTGETLLYEIHGDQKRTQIRLDEIPEYVKLATIATEDKDFYNHPGFDLRGIARAILVDIIKGGKLQGGSTITQQLIKNVILSSEKKIQRKAKELILAYQIEQKFSKDQILEMYFNEIPYGSTAYGIEAGAQTYFSKSAKELDLAETAILTALPKAPTYYSPYGSHREELFDRARYVLNRMVEEGYLEKEKADVVDVTSVKFRPKKESIIAPHFVFYVKELLSEKYGEKMVEEGGLKIITTLDLYKQEKAEQAIEQWAQKNLENYGASNAALVALEPKTGEILAMVGSKDYYNEEIDGNVNVVIRPRQPGSSFKPIVYAAAFKKGYTPETVLYDVETEFITAPKSSSGKPYAPHNYNLREHGPVSMRKALAGSLNIPAVKTIYLTEIDNVLDLADELGYTTLKDRTRFGLSLVLGGGEVKLLEHARAFSAFAREGKLAALQSILKIEDKNSKVIEEFKEPRIKEVLDPNIAKMINNILSDNAARSFIFGAQNYIQLGDRPVAAKTGTTNDFHDAWTIGYTPSLVAGVWAGNNNNAEMKSGADGSRIAAPIWNTFMHSVLNGTPIETFKEPDTSYLNELQNPILKGEQIGEIRVVVDKASGKLATDFTPSSYREEKIYHQAHSILYFINKDDPRGPRLETPSSDPEFQSWENGVKKWVEKQGIQTENPPTEYDDVHSEANRPLIFFVSPQNNETLSNRILSADITTSAPRGVQKVEYYFNDALLTTVSIAPFDLENYQLPNQFENGFYKFRAISYDDVENSHSAEIEINLNAEKSPLALQITAPQNNTSFYASSFPLHLEGKISETTGIREINFYSKNIKSSSDSNSVENSSLIYTTYDFQEKTFSAQWTSAEPGSYQLYTEAVDNNNSVFSSPAITITVLE